MRAFATWLLALGLVATPAMAGTGGDKDSATAKPADDTSAKKTDATDKPAANSNNTTAVPAGLETELQQLRALIEAQSKQLQEQNQEIRLQQQRMQIMENQVKSEAGAPGENADSSAAAPMSRSIAPDADGGKPAKASGFSTGYGTDSATGEDAYQIHYKGITMTPTGFTAAETVWRGKAVSADVNTPFNSVPLPGTSASNVSEFNASGRQSRIGMLFEGKLEQRKNRRLLRR